MSLSHKRKCCVPNCKCDLHFKYSFPKWKNDRASNTRLLKWIQRSGNAELLNNHPSSFYNKIFMCDLHFDANQYVDPQRRKNTKRNAIPIYNTGACVDVHLMETYKIKYSINEVDVEPETSGELTDTASEGEKSNTNDDVLFCKRIKLSNTLFAGAKSIKHDHSYFVNSTKRDHDYITVNDTSSTDSASEDESISMGSSTRELDCFEVASSSIDHSSFSTADNQENYAEPGKPAGRKSKRCFVLNCLHNNLDAKMYSFPKTWTLQQGQRIHNADNFNTCLLWIRLCGNKAANSAAEMYKKSVCGNHFESNDFNNSERRLLKHRSVPSKHLPASLTDNDMMFFQPVVSQDGENHNVEINESINSRLHNPSSRSLGVKFETEMKTLEWHTCDICQEKFLFRNGLNINKVHRAAKFCRKFSKDNLMHPGEIPLELQDLSFVEEQLIARVHPVLCVYKLKGCQYGYSGNVINFSQDVNEFASQLPHRIEDVSTIITVKFENFRKEVVDFRVRSRKVFDALKWLKVNNKHYEHIEISTENLELLPEDGNVYEEIMNMDMDDNNDDEENQENMDEDDTTCNEESQEDLYAVGVPNIRVANQDNQLKKIFHWPTMSGDPVSEFTPSFIMCAFPTLFPYGDCDLMQANRQQKVKLQEYMKHFMSFHDQRFAQHKTFRFFAFNMWMRHSALSDGNVYVKKNTAVAEMNVTELEKFMQENPSELHKLMYIGSNLRGSKAYWNRCCGELKSMVEQIGLPTFFLTLSAADLYWPDLFRLLCNKEIDAISMSERHRLLQNNPMIVDTFFQYRIDSYIENVLEPLYDVKDFWYRIEYQHRGSPHLHGLFWLNNAPNISNYLDMNDLQKEEVLRYYDKLATAVIPDNDCPYPDQHPSEIFFKDIIDESLDLSQLLKKVQFHSKCQKGYCLRKNSTTKKIECRFKFPRDINTNAELQLSKDNTIEFIPERNHPRLNKFNPFLIQSWRANIDIAPVVSKRAILEYIAKYITKNETHSNSLIDVCKSVCSTLHGFDKAKKAIHKILNKNCVERDISAQEVCHILMGHKLHCAGGRNFVIVNTKQKKEDWIAVDKTKVGKSIIEKYCDRPKTLGHITLWQAAKNYNCITWSKLKKKSNIVRVFPRLTLCGDEEKDEMYYRQKVLLHSTWTKESDLNKNNESWKIVHESLGNHHNEEINLGMQPVIENDEVDPEDIVDSNIRNEDWMILAQMHNERNVINVEAGNREIDINHDWSLGTKNYEQFGNLNDFENFIENQKKNNTGDIQEDILPDVTFSADQLKVKDIMNKQINYIKNPNSSEVPPKRIIVQGKAGSGKSLLIKYLTCTLRENFGADSFLLLGPTGVAAVNIGGSTIHSKLVIPIRRRSFKPLSGESARKFCEMFKKIKFIIIDEYSMCGCATMAMVDQRCREGTGMVDHFFGDLNIYLFGDIRQLPPVLDTAVYADIGPRDPDIRLKQHGKAVFNSFEEHFVLNTCFRQTDTNFKNLLDRISVGDLTEDDFSCLRRRFKSIVSNTEQHEKFDDAMCLFGKVEDVDWANNKKIIELVDKSGNLVPIARIPALNNGKNANKPVQAEGLFNTLLLGTGVRVMLKANLWTEKGLVNGAQGIVKDVLYKEDRRPPDRPTVIMVKFEHYTGPGIGPDNLVPIPTIIRSWGNSYGSCTRQQFPLALAYACTIHKAQGLTLDKVVVDITDKEFALGLTYVALSRVRSIEGLLIVDFTSERVTTAIKGRDDMTKRLDFEMRFK